jgi:hypothetical protein
MSNVLIACLLLLSVIGAGARPALAQSLADVAKKEEDRRKANPAPGKVYTNKDLGDVPPAPPPPAEAAPASSSTPKEADKGSADKADSGDKTDAAAKDGPAKDSAAKGEPYWSGRLKELRLQVERDQGYAEAMQTRLNSLNADFVNRDDPVQRAAIDRDRLKAQSELTRLTKAVQDGKKAVADLLEEARRAGVPANWVR